MQTSLMKVSPARPQLVRGPHSAARPQQGPIAARSSLPVLRSAAEDASSASTSNVCSACGLDLSKKASGCDGEGRVVGGVGALPGMGWWPVKAYRPCPNLAAAGKEYVRKGQATNEMLFGGVSLGQTGATALDSMKETAEKGINVK